MVTVQLFNGNNNYKWIHLQWRNNKNSWGWISMTIHWITVPTVLGLMALGLWMVQLGYYDPWYYQAPQIHKSIGLILFGLTLFRILWRMVNTSPKPPAAHSLFEIKAARTVHILIYLVLLCTFTAGYLISTAAGKPIEVFGWFKLPAMLTGFKGQADIAGQIHLILAYFLGGLVLLHALAALKHHFIDKDETLRRMIGQKEI